MEFLASNKNYCSFDFEELILFLHMFTFFKREISILVSSHTARLLHPYQHLPHDEAFLAHMGKH